ncbi:AbrB family transcriptional regulator [Amaricoccus sp.]|uniref:AbrB family transcriptional regulator n=1 Tax=Amaricoccus sp. TaxID=1872485 RepID=UPI001B470A5D|nr:AbrB family transcriptional regulator [Amaricoccus sp.]MBP7242948.1 AbrB family transcriptional regulator [Amaricoccus sp.]
MSPFLGILLSLAIAVLAGVAAEAIGAPLPWLLGPMIASAGVAVAGFAPFGVAPRMPAWSRPVFTPVIGVGIGATVTPQILGQASEWWPSLIAVAAFVVAAQGCGYAILRRLGGFDRPTAYFAASPGGLIDSVLMGEMRGGDTATMATMHLTRIVIAVAAVPLILTFVATAEGQPLHAPVAAAGWPGPVDAALLLLCAVGGALLAVRVRLPAGVMLGPFLASAALHLSGLSSAQVPLLVVHVAQMVVGAMLGLRFSGTPHAVLVRGLGLTFVTAGVSIALAGGFALALDALVPATSAAIFLAFAPGGIAEMGLVAISLGVEPAFVIVHHLARILLTVSLGPILYDRLIGRAR